jgi:2-polyprenyl-3-methyl-5-hydroxy-6-metoxy-1,4-benzoquinol methylase
LFLRFFKPRKAGRFVYLAEQRPSNYELGDVDFRGRRVSDVGCASGILSFTWNAKTGEPKDTWWDIRPEWAVRAIGVLGFEDVKINYHTQRYEGRDIKLYTVVGKRTHGNVVLGH